MRFLGFILRLAIIAAVVIWLAGQPGKARIEWHDYQIETSAAFLLLVTLALALLFYELHRIWRFIREGPRMWRLKNQISRLEKGQKLIEQGLSAIAAGNSAEAGRLAINARKLLGVTPLIRLLQAQAAQLAGDMRTAKEIFRVMAVDSESTVLGHRGLITSAIREGDWDEAARQVENLGRLKPNTPWLDLARFEIAVRQHDWNKAGKALTAAASAKLLDASRARRHQAALLLSASEKEARHGQAKQALYSAEKAVKLAPEWIPALINLAQRQIAEKHFRAALRTIKKGWRQQPHPQLAELYIKAIRSKNPLDIHKKMERFIKEQRDCPEGHLALAETAMAADLWGEARRHLMLLTRQVSATHGVYKLLAKLERRENGDESAAYQWLVKASEAPPDPCWICSSCGGGHEEWRISCSYCEAFDTLEWRTPGVGKKEEETALITKDMGAYV